MMMWLKRTARIVLILLISKVWTVKGVFQQVPDEDPPPVLPCGTKGKTPDELEDDLYAMKAWKRRYNYHHHHHHHHHHEDHSHHLERHMLGDSSSFGEPIGVDCIRCVNINVYFHTIEAEPLLDASLLQDQFDVLQHSFEQTPFNFTYMGFDRTINPEWAARHPDLATQDFEALVGSQLRVGGPDDLNVYFNKGICSILAGYAFIAGSTIYPDNVYEPTDGVWLCENHIGPNGFFYYGKTLIHEVGHWLGLEHTFQGESCSPQNLNDLVDDTPQQKHATPWGGFMSGCQEANSCRNLPGEDPIHNFMDYSGELCWNEFTSGQIERMYAQFDLYRRNLDGLGEVCDTGEEASLTVQVLFDDSPDETFFRLRDWISERNIMFSGNTKHVNFSETMVSRTKCLNTTSIYEFIYQNRLAESIKPPGYFSLDVNGEQSIFGRSLDEQTRVYMISPDVAECRLTEHRFRLEIAYSGSPSDVAFELVRHYGDGDDDDEVVFGDNTLFATKPDKWATTKNATLHVDRCLPAGTYTFTVSNSTDAENDDNNVALLIPVDYYNAALEGTTILARQQESGTVTFNVTIDEDDISSLLPTIVDNLTFSSPDKSPGISVPVGTCFSGYVTVEEKTRGRIRMADLKTGDKVLGRNGVFEPVYMFGHRDPDQQVTMLQIWPSKLEVSKDHLVFVEGRGFIPASMVRVGDQLSNGDRVQNIREVLRLGIFAPFTLSGVLIVNGVLASNYVTLQAGSEVLKIGPVRTLFRYHWLEHAALAPYRIRRHLLWVSRVGNESKNVDGFNELGVLKALGFGYLKLHPLSTFLLLPIVLTILSLFLLVELCLLHHSMLVASVLAIAAGTRGLSSNSSSFTLSDFGNKYSDT